MSQTDKGGLYVDLWTAELSETPGASGASQSLSRGYLCGLSLSHLMASLLFSGSV